MAEKLSLPFYEASCNVFKLMFDLFDIKEQPAEVFQHDNLINISIEVIGDIKGKVIYQFPYSTSLNMVKIMCGMEIEKVDDFVKSAICEIANILSGNIFSLLSAKNIICDILPPSFELEICSLNTSDSKACCISTSAGEVCMNLSLHNN